MHSVGRQFSPTAGRPSVPIRVAAAARACLRKPQLTFVDTPPNARMRYRGEAVWTSRTGWATSSARRGERTHSTAATSATSTQPAPMRKASW